MTARTVPRAAVLFIARSISILGPADAAINPVPVLTLRLEPAMVTVNTNSSSPTIVQFNGTCTVDKLPIERATVTLTSSTDVGWVSQVSPTTMVFTSTTPQAFICTVVIPQGTPNMTGTLKVDGRAVAAGLQSTAETTALITNIGPPPYVPPANVTVNATLPAGNAANRTDNQTAVNGTSGAGPSAGLLGLSNNIWMAAAVAVLAVGVAGYAASRKPRPA
jgi:hypothetical protein